MTGNADFQKWLDSVPSLLKEGISDNAMFLVESAFVGGRIVETARLTDKLRDLHGKLVPSEPK